jgi:hypothetical protein
MSETKTMQVEIFNDDHIWVGGRQYVSLKRFAEARKDAAEEMQMLIDRNDELMKENESLKVLLKERLME